MGTVQVLKGRVQVIEIGCRFLRVLLRNDQMTVMTNNKVQAIQHPRTLRKNSGNGSFADFLATISVNFIESGAHQNRPDFGDTPDQA
jgi:ABC-type sugar transport system ATPase subunit